MKSCWRDTDAIALPISVERDWYGDRVRVYLRILVWVIQVWGPRLP